MNVTHHHDRTRDHRPHHPVADLCIEALAHSEAALLDRVVDLTTERDAYRDLAQQVLHALHDVTIERDILREQIRLDRRRERPSDHQVAA